MFSRRSTTERVPGPLYGEHKTREIIDEYVKGKFELKLLGKRKDRNTRGKGVRG